MSLEILHPSLLMIRITKHSITISAVSLLLTCALNEGHAQDSVNLPDEPGVAAVHADLGRMVLPDSPARSVVPDDPGQTIRPAVDNTTGTQQRRATWRSLAV